MLLLSFDPLEATDLGKLGDRVFSLLGILECRIGLEILWRVGIIPIELVFSLCLRLCCPFSSPASKAHLLGPQVSLGAVRPSLLDLINIALPVLAQVGLSFLG